MQSIVPASVHTPDGAFLVSAKLGRACLNSPANRSYLDNSWVAPSHQSPRVVLAVVSIRSRVFLSVKDLIVPALVSIDGRTCLVEKERVVPAAILVLGYTCRNP